MGLLFRSCLLASMLPAWPTADPATGGNVLVLVADDLGVDQLAAYGAAPGQPQTPVLDSLAEDGVLFRNVWAAPVCSPARATLMTGRHGFRTGIGTLVFEEQMALPQGEWTLPEMVSEGTGGAWQLAAFGKWHLGNGSVGGALAPNLAGWPHFQGTLGGVQDYYEWPLVVDGAPSTETSYVTSHLVDAAVAWIEDASSPWLVYLAFNNPHLPYHAPPPHLHGVDLGAAGAPEQDPAPYFRAMVEALDTEIGRLLSAVDLDETTVLFLADNGTPGEVVLPPYDPAKAKTTVYEGGVRVPMIAAGRGVVAPGRTVEALVQTADLFATVADLAQVDLESAAPANLVTDSVSVVPYLADPSQAPQRDVAYTEIFVPNGTAAPLYYRRAVRDVRYKLIVDAVGPPEFYDLALDPAESENLDVEQLGGEALAAYAELADVAASMVGPQPASAHTYGCVVNPEGSLLLPEDPPQLGELYTFGLDNPLATQAPGALGILFVTLAPQPEFPCGFPLPGTGMFPGVPGELLVDLGSAIGQPLVGSLWGGPGAPAEITVAIPQAAALLDAPVYVQGCLWDVGSEAGVELGLTRGAKLSLTGL